MAIIKDKIYIYIILQKKNKLNISNTQKIFNEANNVKISLTKDKYYESNINIEPLNASTVATKILLEVFDIQKDSIKINQVAKKQIFIGQYDEISPKGNIKTTKGQTYLWKIKTQIEKIRQIKQNNLNPEEWLFEASSFNFIIPKDGIFRQNNSKQSVFIEKKEYQSRKTIIKQNIKIKKEQRIKLYNAGDYSFCLKNTFDKVIGSNQEVQIDVFSQVLSKIGIFKNFKKQKVEFTVLENVKYFVIMPNYKIIEKKQKVNIIVVSDKSTKSIYRFTNPQLVPLFLQGQLPDIIKEYSNQLYNQLSQQRVAQKANNYNIQTNLNVINGKRICVIDKYNGEGKPQKPFLQNLLLKNGFDLIFYLDRFDSKYLTQDFDAIIYISSNNSPLSDQIQFIISKYNQGTGVLLWADNQPYYNEVNVFLQKSNANFQLTGNYYGTKTLQASKNKSIGTFDVDHPVSNGFATLYQGITICYPNTIPSDFNIYAFNTNNILQPSILYRQGDADKGFIWVDSAFTKLFPSYHGSGHQQVTQYTLNVLKYISKKKKIQAS